MSRMTEKEHDHIAKVLAFIQRYMWKHIAKFPVPKTGTKDQQKAIKLCDQLKNIMDDQYFRDMKGDCDSPYYGKYSTQEWKDKSLSSWEIGE